jgi:hypothetical protein
MDRKRVLTMGVTAGLLVGLAVSGARAISAPDKYSLKVPGGLALSEGKGYESWQLVSIRVRQALNTGALPEC